MSLRYLQYATLSFVLFACGEPHNSSNTPPIPKIDSIPCEILFNIPVEKFFEDKEISRKFQSDSENENGFLISGLYAPGCLYEKNGQIFINDKSDSSIKCFKVNGEISLSSNFKTYSACPTYFSMLEDSTVLVLDAINDKILRYRPNGSTIFQSECNAKETALPNEGLTFAYESTKGKNLIIRNSHGDRKIGTPSGKISYQLSDSIIYLSYNCYKTLAINMLSDEKKEFRLPDSTCCKKFIGFRANSPLLLELNNEFSGYNKLIILNGSFTPAKIFFLRPPSNKSEKVVWPDRGDAWPGGIVYFYSREHDVLYGLFSTLKNITVCCWKLN